MLAVLAVLAPAVRAQVEATTTVSASAITVPLPVTITVSPASHSWAIVSATTAWAASHSDSGSWAHGPPAGDIAAIVLGVVVGLQFIAILLMLLWMRRIRRRLAVAQAQRPSEVHVWHNKSMEIEKDKVCGWCVKDGR
ncbi:uncharacterized protein CcaverHIS019_0409070 [Cutaneotrichosporon cavernicola]|uniref:Uncharacterized protein n=1 Tax=Cutaneotrichosporon cavernicola TaxID=279322 RepID=A0AA48QWE8_9TREE|nr:uncharacterized protein CcaverHIS019_0409070 [Cutaneotrichosporon cavernicola]BEI92087.1 hypothetical protein CcaverHIS019_0409070 [Cutaneotrichosporon cavernicola]